MTIATQAQVDEFYAKNPTFKCIAMNAKITEAQCRTSQAIARRGILEDTMPTHKRTGAMCLGGDLESEDRNQHRIFICGRCQNGKKVSDIRTGLTRILKSFKQFCKIKNKYALDQVEYVEDHGHKILGDDCGGVMDEINKSMQLMV